MLSMMRLEEALVLCGLVAAITGVVFSLMSMLARRTETPQDGLTPRRVSRHLLFFALLCLVGQYLIHC
jgi:uncharacterized membrane protein